MENTFYKKAKLATAIALVSSTTLLTGCLVDGNKANSVTTSTTTAAIGSNGVATTAPKGSVQGIVQDTNGNPIAGATVHIGNRTTTTSSGGTYQLDNVAVSGIEIANDDDYFGGSIRIVILPPAGYLGAVVDRASRKVVFMASTEGGVEIETVAEETPELIHKAEIDPLVGPQAYQARELGFKLGLNPTQMKQFVKIFMGLGNMFNDFDFALLEINPLVITDEGNLHCLDGKIGIDGNALYRQPKIREMHDPSQEDAREAHAASFELNYVALDGNVGCMVNGAGLAMGTMDIVNLHGGKPANFLDVGGGATKERVSEAFKIILSDDNVKAVLVNIFGGIVRCDMIAEGIIGAVKEVGVTVPVVVRLEGTNAELGREVLAKSDLNIIAAESLTDAAEKVVAAAEGK